MKSGWRITRPRNGIVVVTPSMINESSAWRMRASASVIVHGNTRTEALARMRQALDSFIIEGVTTTIPFLGRVMRHPDFVAGKGDTKFLEREPHLLKDPT